MSEHVQDVLIIATRVVQPGNDILITYQGGNAQPDLYSLTIIAPNSTPFFTVNPKGALSTTGTPVTPDVGSLMVVSGAAASGQDHVMVIGNFIDGSNQIIADVFV
jgi:hypothetical protein